ncbi:MAG: hypothetical protein JW801_03640 [Bacteroidales bacterium]|nr:hypothetical protein [Bacteroidales bacterium]
MKTTAKLILSLALTLLSIQAFASDDDIKELKPPKNAILISQASYNYSIIYTMIDLENNEMVLVLYGGYQSLASENYKLRNVIRTGIYIDPEQQKGILNTFPVINGKREP